MNRALALAYRPEAESGMEAFHSNDVGHMPFQEMDGRTFDEAIDKLGFTQVGFADWLTIGQRSVRRYVQTSAPPHIAAVVELLQQLYVPAAPPLDTTPETAEEAIRPVLRAIADKAGEQRWPKAMIADVFASIAAELRAEAEQEPPPKVITLKV